MEKNKDSSLACLICSMLKFLKLRLVAGRGGKERRVGSGSGSPINYMYIKY